MSRELSDAERVDWLRLWRSDHVGPVTFQQLLRRFGSAAAALAALPELARRGGSANPIRVCSRAEAERELTALAGVQGRMIGWSEADYPPLLAQVDGAPPLLSVRGNAHLLRRPAMAIVGARNASALGVRFARTLAADLAAQDLVIVSGLARGIDRAAHEGSLERGTVAVLGPGIDVVYPPENADLFARIAEQGVLLAEMPFGTEPKPQHFPRRNRLISGASLGVVVVEAAMKSGSLITARRALEQGREVFAVPGSPLDQRARGANDLIRQGATLVESADDVMQVLRPMLRQPLEAPAPGDLVPPPLPPPDEAALPPARARIIGLLGPSPVGVDELVRQSGLAPAVVHTVLLELELAGRLNREPGNRVMSLS
jgi:DNA processing protein